MKWITAIIWILILFCAFILFAYMDITEKYPHPICHHEYYLVNKDDSIVSNLEEMLVPQSYELYYVIDRKEITYEDSYLKQKYGIYTNKAVHFSNVPMHGSQINFLYLVESNKACIVLLGYKSKGDLQYQWLYDGINNLNESIAIVKSFEQEIIKKNGSFEKDEIRTRWILFVEFFIYKLWYLILLIILLSFIRLINKDNLVNQSKLCF